MNDSIPLFSIVNPHFFGLLTGKNKTNNFLLLVQTGLFFGTQFSVERAKLVERLSDYIKDKQMGDVGDIGESVDHEEGLNVRLDEDNAGNIYQRKASAFVRSMETRGWLDPDTDKRTFERIVSRTDAFVTILKALTDLIAEETEAKEEARYIVLLYRQISDLHRQIFPKKEKFNGATVSFQNIDETSRNLEKELLSVNSRIKRFVARIMGNTEMGEKEILTKLTVDYQKLGAYIAFHNLMTKYNPNNFSSDIIRNLQDLREADVLSAFKQDYFKTKMISSPTSRDEKEAADFFLDIIEKVITQMEDISSALGTISSRNQAYVINSSERIRFRLNNERDVKRDINEILKKIKDEQLPSDEEIGDCFELYRYRELDSKSLYAPRAIVKVAPKKIPFSRREPSQEARQMAEELIRQENLYSIDAINRFVLENMGHRTFMPAKDFKVIDETSWVRLLLIPVLSSDSRAKYEITPERETTFEQNGFLIHDYDVRLKEEKK